MNIRLGAWTLAALILCSPMHSFAQTTTIFSITKNDVETVYTASDARLKATPRWTPDQGTQPPLSTQAALAAAKKALKSSRTSDLATLDIQLSQTLVGDEYCWYYFITLYDLLAVGTDGLPVEFEALVLMDGSVVEPSRKAR